MSDPRRPPLDHPGNLSTQYAPSAPPHIRHRRWPILGVALAVMVIVIAAGSVGWWFVGSGSEQWARWHWQAPEQVLLPSMQLKPVPGWTADVADLGLPIGAKIATDGESNVPGPIIKASGSRIYVLAQSAGPTTLQWWLAALDTGDGHAVFSPVALNTSPRAPGCFMNGPSVVCIADDQQASTAWVIDGQSGKLTYNGPSDVRLATGKREARQVGGYLVAQTANEGVHGVGANAETTWSVPGVGVIGPHNEDLAFQSVGEGSGGTLFSLGNGSTIKPELPAGAYFQNLRFFDGGFAAGVVEDRKPTTVQFFDSAARPITDERLAGQQVADTTANLTAVVEDNDSWGIYTPNGNRLLRLPRERIGGIQLIGSMLWVGEETPAGLHREQPYDLRTGDAGRPCAFDLRGYLGTDGSVALRTPFNPKADDVAQAYDLTTCNMVWSIPRPAGSLALLTLVNTTLVQLSDDGTQLRSLVAPR